MKFATSFRVQGSDIDDHQHVNNVAYLRWIQEIAVGHWQAKASADIQEKFTWFVLRHEIDYKKPSFEDQEITATTWVGQASKIKCDRFTEIRRSDDILVEAKSVWCLFDRESGKPAGITEELREIFGMT